jgi:replicative DNA helicase
MPSKYVDTPSIVQVIGCVCKIPQLLDYADKYTLTEEDFPEQFHKIVFGTIYKLHELGAEKITLNSILDYLSARPKSEAIFIKQKGEEWLIKAVENA